MHFKHNNACDKKIMVHIWDLKLYAISWLTGFDVIYDSKSEDII